MWDLAGSGMEPMFPALADRFLSTVPLRKSKNVILFLFLTNQTLLFFFLTLQYCIGFALYQHESATGMETGKCINILNQNIWPKQKLQSNIGETGTRRIYLVKGAGVIFITFYAQTHAYRTFKMPYFGRYSKKIGWINAFRLHDTNILPSCLIFGLVSLCFCKGLFCALFLF